MKAIALCLFLVLVPAWCRQSDKPSPFEVKTREKNKPQRTPIAKSASPKTSGPAGNTGIATFFRASVNSRHRTARGEAVNDDGLTAAHLTLPLGSRVRVVNLGNNRSVVVRITGRGTFPPGRIISVNYRAAKELDFLKAGTAHVRLEPADK